MTEEQKLLIKALETFGTILNIDPKGKKANIERGNDLTRLTAIISTFKAAGVKLPEDSKWLHYYETTVNSVYLQNVIEIAETNIKTKYSL